MPVPRKEGRDKVTGRAQYIDDITLPGMLYGATVRSQHSAGEDQEHHIRSRDSVARIRRRLRQGHSGEQLRGADLRRSALPGRWRRQSSAKSRFCCWPIRAAAHLAGKAVSAVVDRIRSLPALFTIEESEQQSLRSSGARTTYSKRFLVEKGNVDAVWRDADVHRRRGILRPARRNSFTSRTTESSPASITNAESRYGARCSVRITCTKR